MVKDESHQQEIMKAFGFKTAGQVKASYLRALVDSGEVPAIKGGRAPAKGSESKTDWRGKRGSIIIAAEKVAELGIGAGDKFMIRKTRAGIAPKKI